MQWSQWSPVPVVTAPRVGEINADTVTQLRNETDYPMMECKKALYACNGDFEKAKEWLRNSSHRFKAYI
jgi:translation elongation factor EF-Ts